MLSPYLPSFLTFLHPLSPLPYEEHKVIADFLISKKIFSSGCMEMGIEGRRKLLGVMVTFAILMMVL